MKIIEGLVNGPFKSEDAFKAAVLKVWRKTMPQATFFEIENEEKEPGMPDVLKMSRSSPAVFIEFKIADYSGHVMFQKTQPLFYKLHRDLWIHILVWDPNMNRVVSMDPYEIIEAKKLRVKIDNIDVSIG